MRTSKPISTISYNTEPFLKRTLEKLQNNHLISTWFYIKHFREEDEKKEHFHVYIKPNKLLDTMELQQEFLELDLSNPKKPLKCLDFRVSNVDDWILYNQHFRPYLASKMESRLHFYTREDFVFSDEDEFDFAYNHAFKGSDWAKSNQILECLSDGSFNPSELIQCGVLPLNMASQLNSFMYMKTHYGTDRGTKENHEDN